MARGEVKFQARTNQAKRTFPTLEQARSWIAEIRDGSKRPGWVDPSRFTVREICDKWIAARRAEVGTPGGIREVTVNGYASSLHALLLVIGDDIAREVGPKDIEAALRVIATKGGKWKRPLSHRSVSYALGSLRQAFDFALREKWLTENPADLAKAPRKEAGSGEKKMLRWNPSQLTAFRTEADTYGEGEKFEAEPWLRAGMRLTLCGLRRSEVLGFDWKYLDLDDGASTLVRQSRVKTGRGNATALGPVKTDASKRAVQTEKIHPGTAAALRALWLKQGCPAEGLVIRDAKGQPVHPDLYSERFRAVCDKAGVPRPARVHNVRHSIATALSEAGVSDHQAAALLGHDVDTYRRFYLVVDDEGAAEAAEAAGAIFAL
ncbi:MAG: tyrosine-type recombinase/integrase [Promicromonosporaceae bacterium]|nr:tyrosine-type recombinase/integrase [Promicromonosporaceae bacterium]